MWGLLLTPIEMQPGAMILGIVANGYNPAIGLDASFAKHL
jgi:hypothetical protein